MTRGTPASSQIIFLEQKVEDLNAKLEEKDKRINDLLREGMTYFAMVEQRDVRIKELEAKCERLKYLTDPQIDRIVITSLKKQYRLESTFGNGPDEALLKSLNSVISLYSSVDEWCDWVKEKQELDGQDEKCKGKV